MNRNAVTENTTENVQIRREIILKLFKYICTFPNPDRPVTAYKLTSRQSNPYRFDSLRLIPL